MTAPVTSRPGRVAWLVLAYRPVSRGLNMTVRRQLTALGAVFPVPAVAAMPASPTAERALRRLRRTIGEAGGAAHVLRAEVVEGLPDLLATFNHAREREYGEIIAACAEVLAGIDALGVAGQFRYQDLGEKDAAVKRLRMRKERVRARDAFSAANAESALSCLASCRAAVDNFATRVYEADNITISGASSGQRSPDAPW